MNKTLFCTFLLYLSCIGLFGQTDLYWAGELTGDEYNQVLATDIDPQGNILVAGTYLISMDADMSVQGQDQMPRQGGANAFVAKYGPDGGIIWHRSLNEDRVEKTHDVKTDAYGNVWIAGQFSDGLWEQQLDIDPDPNRTLLRASRDGSEDFFVAVLSPDGATKWVKTFGTNGYDNFGGLAVDAQGNGYLTGSMANKSPLARNLGTSSHGSPDIWVAKLNPRGAVQWQFKHRATAMGYPRDIAVDDQGNVFLTGSFRGKCDFGPDVNGRTELLSANLGPDDEDIFLAKFNASGQLVWARDFGGRVNDEGESLCVDGQGGVYVGGRYHSTMDFDPSPSKRVSHSSKGRFDAFLSRFDADGNLIWGNSIGGEAWDNVMSIDLDREGNPVIGGFFTTWCEFDSSPKGTFRLKGPNRNYQGFVAKYAAEDGKFTWARQFGGAEDDQVNAIAVGPQGYIVAGGDFEGNMSIEYAPGQSVTLSGSHDNKRGFVVYLAENMETSAVE